MLVNLYVDHMMAAPATSSDDVLAATRDHSALFSEAAAKIGLTPAEYREFRANLLDGNAMYVKLPRRVDAMSANHNGRVYVVKNAVVSQSAMSWRVALKDGNVVYVPQICGNISLVRPVAVAAVKLPKPVVLAAHRAKFVPAIGTAASPVVETPVVVAPPADAIAPAAVAPVAYVPASVPIAAVPATAGGISPFFFAIPAVIAGVVAGTTHHDSPTAPPCSQGSNLQNACQK